MTPAMHFHVGRKIALADGEEFLPILGALRLDGILLAHHAPPDRAVLREVFHGRPVRVVVREDHARPAFALDEFRAAFHPVLFVESHHESGLVVERGVVAIHARLQREFAQHGKYMKWPLSVT